MVRGFDDWIDPVGFVLNFIRLKRNCFIYSLVLKGCLIWPQHMAFINTWYQYVTFL